MYKLLTLRLLLLVNKVNVMDSVNKGLLALLLFFTFNLSVSAAPGSALWSVDIGGNIGSSAAYDSANGQLYVGSADKRLYVLDNVGNVLWTFATQGYISAAPVVSADGAKAANGGVVKSDLSGTTLVKPQKSKRGVTPDPAEWQFDHKVPKSCGGTNCSSNLQILSRQENRAKSNN